jgi:hypothetical protein
VESGRPVELEPGTTRARYVLTVTDGARTATAELPLAVEYRHRLDPVRDAIPRTEHAAILLEGGRVLLGGGLTGAGWEGRTELWDPLTGRFELTGELDVPPAEATTFLDRTFTPTGAMHHGCAFHAAVALATGEVLIAGGVEKDGARPATVEIYQPDTGRFSVSPASLPSGRTGLALVPLADGSVLVHGGRTASGTADGATGVYR